jgi:hypothetical protein
MPHSIQLPVFAMTLLDLYLDIFVWISAPSCPQPEVERNRLSDMSFVLGVHGQSDRVT